MQNRINCINIRYDRFKKNTHYEIANFNSIDFNKGLKSINSKKTLFINKCETENDDVYDSIVNMYLKHLDGDYSFLDDFVCDELLLDYKTDRLLDIINEVQHSKYNRKDLKTIFKLNNLNDKKLHFFIKVSRKNFTIILIDLYHMAIYGDNIVNGKVKKIPMEKIYKKYKNNLCCLDNIKELSA